MRILVVCTANICRSPVAQLLLAKQLEGSNAVVHSAGTQADFGRPADPRMLELAQARGLVNLQQHASQPVLPLMLNSYNIALCMEQRHLTTLQGLAPTKLGGFKLLGHWNGGEIADPYMGTDRQYDAALSMIVEATQHWARKLRQLGMVT